MALYWLLCLSLSIAMGHHNSWMEGWVLTTHDGVLPAPNAMFLSTRSRLHCAAQASNLVWPNIFCYMAVQGLCVLSDVLANPYLEAATDFVYCMTRVNPEVCKETPENKLVKLGHSDFLRCVNGTFPHKFPYAVECSHGFELIGPFGCVLMVNEPRTWSRAREFCMMHGADLIPIQTDYKLMALQQYIRARAIPPDSDVWIGLQRKVPGGAPEFKFISGDQLLVHHWQIGKPDNPELEWACARLNTLNTDDIDCNTLNRFVCEILL